MIEVLQKNALFQGKSNAQIEAEAMLAGKRIVIKDRQGLMKILAT